MRQLLPDERDVDPTTTYLAADRPRPGDRPWIAAGMIASLDGATALEGRSGGLGGPADAEILRAVRGMADVILVGAGTVRAESYGPVRLSAETRDARVAAGRGPGPPRLAIVTRGLDLDPTSRVFTEAEERPLVLTVEHADQERADSLAEVAEVHRCGTDTLDVSSALAVLGDASVVVCEGGPGLNATLVADDVVDEWCLTIAPTIVGGQSSRIVRSVTEGSRAHRLESLLTDDGFLFGRWVRRR